MLTLLKTKVTILPLSKLFTGSPDAVKLLPVLLRITASFITMLSVYPEFLTTMRAVVVPPEVLKKTSSMFMKAEEHSTAAADLFDVVAVAPLTVADNDPKIMVAIVIVIAIKSTEAINGETPFINI